MTEPEITVKKLSTVMPYARDLADDYPNMSGALHNLFDPNRPAPPPPVDPGPHPGYLRLVAAAEAHSFLAMELVALHSPKWNEGYSTTYRCLGDEYGGGDAEPADWPCETVAILAKHLGVEL